MDEQRAVAVAEPGRQTLEGLQKTVTAKEAEYEQLHETYTDLWQQRKTATLDDMGYVRYLRTEDRMALLLEELEHLRPQRDAARLREAALAAQAHHDAGVPTSQRLVQEATHAFLTASKLWAQVGAVFDDQQTPIVGIRDKDGNQALRADGGDADARALFQALFGGDSQALVAWQFLLRALTLYTPAALADCARLKPYPSRGITNYLNTLTEGQTHANGR